MGCCTLGISEMEAICRTWKEPRVLGGDAPEFGGGADEFLNGEEDGSNARSCREGKGEGCTDVFIR